MGLVVGRDSGVAQAGFWTKRCAAGRHREPCQVKMTVTRLVKRKHYTNSIWNLKLFNSYRYHGLDLTGGFAQGYVKGLWMDYVMICAGLNCKYRCEAAQLPDEANSLD